MGDDDVSNLSFDETSQPMDVDEPSQAASLEDQCYCGSEPCRSFNLSHQLDNILDPGLIYSAPNQPMRLWSVLARGHQDETAFIEKLNEYRVESHCSLAWPTGYVGYRCRTCSLAPSMSICTECFRAGNHEGHDYNMFKSISGGACDCGHNSMKPSGYCSRHGRNAKAPRSHEPVPDSLTCIASRAMPRIISRLVIQLRRQAVGQTMETDIYLDCLMQFANSSAVIRNLMIQVMLSREAYSSQAKFLSQHPDARVSKIVRESQKILKRERKKLFSFTIPPSWPKSEQKVNADCDKATHKTFLEELVFWMVTFEFDQKLVFFLLGFLIDDHYKNVFSRIFVGYYPHLAVALSSSPADPRRRLPDPSDHLSRKMQHVCVQILNDDDLTKVLCKEEMVLHLVIYCLRIVIEGSQSDGIFSALKSNPLCLHSSNAPKVVCCDTPILRDRYLCSFAEDIIAILNFDHGARHLVSDKNLLQVWIEMLSYFQTMSPYKRELNEHAPYETGPRQSVFLTESEFCLVPLWTMLGHFKEPESLPYTSQLLESIHANIASWFYKMSIGPHSKLDTYFMSFHIPLHRMLAATIRHMIFEQKIPEEQVFNILAANQAVFGSKFSYKSAHGIRVIIKIEDFIKMLLLHPLQALTLYHQTRSGMWTRNGILTVNQAITYVHCAYCYSIIDMDMFLLRYCASHLKPDVFLKSFLQKFYAWHCLSFTCGPIFSDTASDTLKVHYYFNIQPEQITQMMESCLVTLIQLLTLGYHCNTSDREQTKREMIGLISVADRSFSYLTDMMPNICEQQKDEETLSALLSELTVYKPASHGSGGSLQQGCYTLKSQVWEEDYNPIHILYRYYHRRDYQQSLDRFFQHAKATGKLSRRSHSSALWPPLKAPDNIGDFGATDLSPLITCQTLLGLIFSILYKCIYIEELSDTMMAYTIHLLELSLRKQLTIKSSGLKHDDEGCSKQTALEDSAAKSLTNPSFVGKYSYRELISYYESMPKDEALLKGRTIYSLFTEEPIEPEPHLNVKLFPFVKHALDLAFETTWFPFKSVIDNCLVHIETVHSLPREEFDAMIQCSNIERAENENYEDSHCPAVVSDRAPEHNLPDMSTTSSTRSTESQTGTWSNLIGLEVEEVDDIEIEVDEDEEGSDEELEIVDESIGVDEAEVENSSDFESSLLNQLSANEASSFTSSHSGLASAARASTSLATTATRTLSTSAERDPSGALATHGNLQMAPNNTEMDSRSGRARNIQGYIRIGDYLNPGAEVRSRNPADQRNPLTSDSPTSTSVSLDRATAYMRERLDLLEAQVRNNSVLRPQERHLSHSSPAQSSQTAPNDRPEQISWQQPAQAQNLITERRAILNSEPRPMITNLAQPAALETGSTSSVSTNTTGPASVTTNQVLQQAHRSRVSPEESGEFSAVVLEALEELSENLTGSRQEQQRPPQQQRASNQIERSLSEIDIHARFAGFFQPDTTSSPRANPSRTIRTRQTARRGNYRGAYLIEPYLPYANINAANINNNNNNQANVNNANNASNVPVNSSSSSSSNNNNNNNNNNITDGFSNNNNNTESVQELVRRSVAIVPTITEAVRSTMQQAAAQRVENFATGSRSLAFPGGIRGQNRGGGGPEESSPFSSPSPPPPNLPGGGERAATSGRQDAVRSFSFNEVLGLFAGQTTFRVVNRFSTSRSQQIQQDQQSRRLRKEHRQHHGESILTLLLRLHAKYSHQPRSYHYNEQRAQANSDPRERCRIGDGTHFVTIALDLICSSDAQIRQRVDYLTELIWPRPLNERQAEQRLVVGGLDENEKGLRGATSAASSDDIEIGAKTSNASKSTCAGATALSSKRAAPGHAPSGSQAFVPSLSSTMKLNAGPTNPMALLTPEEKRHRAKERQTRLMAEFANKQRAFMEKYTASVSATTGNVARPSGSRPNTGASTSAASGGGVLDASKSSPWRQSGSPVKPPARDSLIGIGSDSHEHSEEEPINLSSKANQEGASRSRLSTDGNGAQHHKLAASGASQSRPAQATRPEADAAGEDIVMNATTSDLASLGSGEQQRQRPQQQGSILDERKDKQGSSGAFDLSPETTYDVPQYECCICGTEGPSDWSNPLGQVVFLQSTSVYGHSHLRPRSERKLPCDESDHLNLKEETYAKYLERRIDILCDQFAESSWLDSINIGAEGGVHVQSCGHHLHIECHQSYIRSLDQEDGLRARSDSDEFQCPVCRQLANSVLPILSSDFFLDTNRTGATRASSSSTKSPASAPAATQADQQPRVSGVDLSDGQSFVSECGTSRALARSQRLDDQIVQVGLQLQIRRVPNQQELQSSATFCSHLTKATGPQYRLIRTNASMQSLFLFLSSIARTNLETSLIARSIKSQLCQGQATSSAPNPPDDGGSAARCPLQLRRAESAGLAGSLALTERLGARRRSCYQLLFHVLALNAQTLINHQWCTYDHVWSWLTRRVYEINRQSVRPRNSEVPLLLRDPVAMLLQFLFTISGSKTHHREHFTCLVKILFNLTVIQSTALVLSHVKSIPLACQPSDGQSVRDDLEPSEISSPRRSGGNPGVKLEEQASRDTPSARAASKNNQLRSNQGLENLLSLVWANLNPLLAQTREEPLMNSVVRNSWPRFAGRLEEELWSSQEEEQEEKKQQQALTGELKKLEFIENKIKLACLPFLRAAAFLQEDLYGRPSPGLNCELDEACLCEQVPVEEDFAQLVRCLELETTDDLAVHPGAPIMSEGPRELPRLVGGGVAAASQPPARVPLEKALNWPSNDGHALVVSWAAELVQFARERSIAARTLLLSRPLAWNRPGLMQLPHAFDDIFMFYYRRKCSLCQQVPKDVAVCLVCGAPICFRASCCKDRSRSRQVHSQHCGANTAVFLAIHTSAVVVIRGNRACVWGSVYLDAHDEEDNGLQRGKPLYMVPARFALLETQWLTHSFDHTCGKRWIYLQETQ